ncbi:MAG: STAS domain-containing protein [Ignavibacteriaceae bacterium]
MNTQDIITETVNDVFIVIINLKRATLEEAGIINKILLMAIGNGWKKLLIEMYDVEYIDSTFIGTLVLNLKKIKELNGKFGLVGLQSSLNNMIQQINLDKTFEIFKSRTDAIKNI